MSDLVKTRFVRQVHFLIPQKIGAHLNNMEVDPLTQLHYPQFASLYQGEDFPLRWKSKDSYVLDLELCVFGML